jgi:hypothetical protein
MESVHVLTMYRVSSTLAIGTLGHDRIRGGYCLHMREVVKKDMHSTQRAYLGVKAIYREIAGGNKIKISVFKWTLFDISILASQYFKVSVLKKFEMCWSKS